uniref:Uncharacterized protein n=1 Tax=Nymphaea colorata TaxID=210225 RepID=A0A5K1B626_9MAGN
MTELTLAAI